MTPSFYRRRAGFTLIELLVVLFIISVLAAITVAVARSNVADSYKTIGGGDRLSGWLLIAKNRALRDKVPVGVRLIRDPNNPNVAREAQYVEMPVLWAPNQLPDGFTLGNGTVSNPAPPFVVVQYGYNQQGVAGHRQEDGIPSAASNFGVFVFGLNILAFDVKVGDLLSLAELGSVHRIEAITPLTTAPSWYPTASPPGTNLYSAVNTTTFLGFKLTLAQSVIPLRSGEQYPPSPPNPPMMLPVGTTAAPPAGFQTATYPVDYPQLGAASFYRTFFFGFYRSARPILGEPLVTLPTNMVVDMTPDTLASPPAAYPVYRNPSIGLPSMNNTALDVDLIFAPSGQVMFTDNGLVCFWLRNELKSPAGATLGGTPLLESTPDVTNGYRFFDRNRMLAAGDGVIVAVYTKTGAIGTYQVYTPEPVTNRYYQTPNHPEDPYRFVRDAFNRGL